MTKRKTTNYFFIFALSLSEFWNLGWSTNTQIQNTKNQVVAGVVGAASSVTSIQVKYIIYHILYIIYLVIWIDILRINYMLYLYIYMISSSSKLSDQMMIMMPFTFLYQYIIIFKLTQTAHLLSLLHCKLLHFCI